MINRNILKLLTIIDNRSENWYEDGYEDFFQVFCEPEYDDGFNKTFPNGDYLHVSVSKERNIIQYYPINSYYNFYKEFYENGNIAIKGKSFNNDFNCGIWYYFHQDKWILDEKDFDQGYFFTIDQVLKFCLSRSIIFEKGYPVGSPIPTISRKNKTWHIGHYVGQDLDERWIILSGKTGEIIEEISYDEYIKKYIDPEMEYFQEILRKRKAAGIITYKIFLGHFYTKEEWEAYVKQRYEEHLKKQGKTILITPTIPKIIVDEKDFVKKSNNQKKSFWERLFGN